VTSSTYSTFSRMTKQTTMAPKVANRQEYEKMTMLLHAMLVLGSTSFATCTIQPRLLRMLNGLRVCTNEFRGCREFRRRGADRPVATFPFCPLTVSSNICVVSPILHDTSSCTISRYQEISYHKRKPTAHFQHS
jgi:hypothetical protein